jgi:hypothetical protein
MRRLPRHASCIHRAEDERMFEEVFMAIAWKRFGKMAILVPALLASTYACSSAPAANVPAAGESEGGVSKAEAGTSAPVSPPDHESADGGVSDALADASTGDAAPASSSCIAIATASWAFADLGRPVWFAGFTPRFPGETKDSVLVTFAAGAAAAGTYTLGVGDDDLTANVCKHCVEGLGGPSLSQARNFIATSGTFGVMQVDPLTQRLLGSLDGVRFDEATVDATTQLATLKPGGACLTLAHAVIDVAAK